jgi:hypothetical protein
VAVASTVAATHTRDLLGQSHTAAVALTGGFHWAFWVCAAIAAAAVPLSFVVPRRIAPITEDKTEALRVQQLEPAMAGRTS